MSDDTEQHAYVYESLFVDGALVLRLGGRALIVSVVLFALLIVFRDQIMASGLSGPIHGFGIGIAIFLPVAMIFLARVHHTWRLYPDRLEIEERPDIPLVVKRVRAVIPFRDIKAVSLTARFGGTNEFELVTSAGGNYRLTPHSNHGGPGNYHFDHAGFRAFLNKVQDTVAAAGVDPPPVQPRLGAWASPIGLIALGFGTALGVVGVLVSLWSISRGKPDGLKVLLLSFAFTAICGASFFAGWRGYQAKRQKRDQGEGGEA